MAQQRSKGGVVQPTVVEVFPQPETGSNSGAGDVSPDLVIGDTPTGDNPWADQPQGEAAELLRTGADRVVNAAAELARAEEARASKVGSSIEDRRVAAAARELANALAEDRA